MEIKITTLAENTAEIGYLAEWGLSMLVEADGVKVLFDTGMGIVGPKGLPPEVIKKWEQVVQTTLKDPAVISAIHKFDFVPDYQTGDQYKKEVSDEFALFKKIISQSK